MERLFAALRCGGSRRGLLGYGGPGPATATLTLLLCGSLVCYLVALVQRPAVPAARRTQLSISLRQAPVALRSPARISLRRAPVSLRTPPRTPPRHPPIPVPGRGVASGAMPPRLPRPSPVLPPGAGPLPDSPPPARPSGCAFAAPAGGPPSLVTRCAAPPALLFQPATLRGARAMRTRLPALQPAGATVPQAASPTPAHTSQIWVTGYDLAGQTATGLEAGPGVCAVDPSFIPLGARLSIAGVGECVAQDTGPEVIGEHVDVWVPNSQVAYAITGWHTARW